MIDRRAAPARHLSQQKIRATITLGCALGYLDFRMPQLVWRDGRAVLIRWYELFAARKSMQATIPQHVEPDSK